LKLALLVLVIALGGLIGALVARDPGYVLVAYQETALETSLWFALLALLAAYFLVRLAVRSWSRLARGRGALTGWNRRRHARAAEDRALRGHLLLAQAQWAEAGKLLQEAAAQTEMPLLHHLAAARAANGMGDFPARDRSLAAARAAAQDAAGGRPALPDAELTVGLIQAELQTGAGEWEACRATLEPLRQRAPRHPRVLGMLADCHRRLGNWEALTELLPELEKRHVLDGESLLQAQVQAWLGRLAGGTPLQAPDLVKQLPKALRRRPELVGPFARALSAAGHGSTAEGLLRAALEASWDAGLLHLYGVLDTPDPGAQRVAAEGWLRDRPGDPDLLLALGRISLKSRLWARAREHLEASLRLRESPDVQAELGRLCLALGERERGAELLGRALRAEAPLPLPERAPAVPAESAQSGLGA
jgi:HemY protein